MNTSAKKAIKKYSLLLGILLFMAVLLIFSDTSLRASKRGMLLWSRTMLPTLLPYMIAVNLLLYLMPQDTSCIKGLLLLGPLCGYPMGAKICASLYTGGYLTKKQAEYYLPLVNLPSPAYLISFVCVHGLKTDTKDTLLLHLFLLYGAILLYAFLSALLFHPFQKKKHAETHVQKQVTAQKGAFFDNCILDAFLAITKLGGYIILFSILGELVYQLILPISELGAVFGVGILEITNGTEMIIGSGLSFYQKKLLLLSTTGFGGISCIFQTKSLLADTGISMKKYVFAKTAAAMLTAMLSILLI